MNWYQIAAEKQLELENAEDALRDAEYDNSGKRIEKAKQVLFMVCLKTGLKSNYWWREDEHK